MDLIIIFSAEYLGYILLAVFLIWFWKNRSAGWQQLFVPLISALVSRFVFTELIRFLYYRPRPFVSGNISALIEPIQSASFPSGHAAFFFALSAGIYSFNKKTGLWFFTGSLVIGLARVFAGVHYFSDIIGGVIVGLLSYWLVGELFKKIILSFKKKQGQISVLP